MGRFEMKRFALTTITFLALSLWSVRADVPIVKAKLEPDSILIGDRTTLSIEVDKDVMQLIGFPMPENGKFGERLEVLADFPPDTVKTGNRQERLIKRYLLTSFDEGVYAFPPVPVLYVDKNITDTIYTADNLFLTVNTIPVDTLNNDIYDIKAPMQTPALVGEYAGWVGMAILAAVVLASIIWFVAVRRRREVVEQERRAKEPPHLRAIRELEQLNNQKVWQNNRHKQYYTRLTDILREYIDGRWGVGAMEMTTDQLDDAIREAGVDIPAKNRDELFAILREADLVKFAKHIPEALFNEEAYYKAYYFVEQTKQVQQQKVEQPKQMVEIDNVQESEKDSVN